MSVDLLVLYRLLLIQHHTRTYFAHAKETLAINSSAFLPLIL